MERPATRRLREELKQNKPFQGASHAASLALLRTADEVRRRLDTLIAPHGLSAEQFNVLRILRGAGEFGLPTLEIAARLVERNPGITRLLDKLEAKKFVLRRRCDKDRRHVYCKITEAGLDVVSSLDEPGRLSNLEIFRALSPQEIDTLIDLLDRLRHPNSSGKTKEKL